MGNKRIYKLFMLFVFLMLFFGCKKNDYSYGDDYINLSGKYTEDNKYCLTNEVCLDYIFSFCIILNF